MRVKTDVIKKLRRELHISCDQAAEFLNFSSSVHYYLREINREPFTATDVATLSKLLCVPADTLVAE